MSTSYPERLDLRPLNAPPHAAVRVPGSKSITNRALVLAALTAAGDGGSWLEGALRSEDTEVMVEALRRLGFAMETQWESQRIGVGIDHAGPRIPATHAELFVANSGTSMRFLTAMVALGNGRYRLDGVPRMRERPVQDLLDALGQLGVRVWSEAGNGCPPVVVETSGLPGGHVTVKGGISSQFLSGLMMAAPFAQNDMTIAVDGPLVSVPYVNMTLAMLRQFGLRAQAIGAREFHIPARQTGGVRTYAVEPDASAASYFFGAAAITGGKLTVTGFPRPCLQGDVAFVDVMQRMGCAVANDAQGLTVRGAPLRGIDIDMNAISDTVMTLGAVACFAEGSTTIRNVAHIRHKETDRLAALATELRRVGAGVEEFADGLTIHPRPLHGAEIETYNDHRMAMSMALIGLKVPGIVIKNPGCVAKTYPGFWDDLEKLRRHV